MENSYSPPVEALLRHSGNSPIAGDDSPPNYRQELNLTVADIPELARLAADKSFDACDDGELEFWAPYRAARVLAQFAPEAPEAITGLVALFDQGDRWYMEDLTEFFLPAGPVAFEPLLAYFLNESKSEIDRMSAQGCLRAIAKAYPETRDRYQQELLAYLENYRRNPPLLNATAMGELIQDYPTEAREAAPLFEAAYKAKRIDINMAGPWASVQVDLGLRPASDFKPEDLKVPLHLRPKYAPALIKADPLDVLKSVAKASQRPEVQGFGSATPAKKSKKKKKKK